jgi:hypothetical protein
VAGDLRLLQKPGDYPLYPRLPEIFKKSSTNSYYQLIFSPESLQDPHDLTNQTYFIGFSATACPRSASIPSQKGDFIAL